MQTEDVEKAYDELLAFGMTPSVRRVRERLGYGSLSDINRMLAEIRSEREIEAMAEITLPAGLREKSDRFLAQVWGALRAEADARLSTARAEADAIIAGLEDRLAAVLADADEMQVEIDGLKAERDSSSQRLGEEVEKRVALEKSLAISQSRLVDAARRTAALQRTVDLTVTGKPRKSSSVHLPMAGAIDELERELVLDILSRHIEEAGSISSERLEELPEFVNEPASRLDEVVEKLVSDGRLRMDEKGALHLPDRT